LTSLLAARAQRLIAIEVDRVLAAQLRMKYARHANVEVIEGDVLAVDLENLIRRKPGPLLAGPAMTREEAAQKAKVIGNLPYYITSDIILKLLNQYALLETIVVMVQREVAERIAAVPGTRDYGLLSATVQLFCRTEKLFTLAPGAFSPPPDVHSSVLRLRVAPQLDELGVEAKEFIGFLKASFAQKRKTLANNLKPHYTAENITVGLRTARIKPDARAEAIPMEKMAVLFKTMAGTTPTW
jgi:16S rRNA (adenine1518-N6/adenine1519-N6)-dimethyltransferase